MNDRYYKVQIRDEDGTLIDHFSIAATADGAERGNVYTPPCYTADDLRDERKVAELIGSLLHALESERAT